MTTLFILGWLALGDLWTVFSVPVAQTNDVAAIELRNHQGEVLKIKPQSPHHCSVSEAEHESITWRCTGPAEFTDKHRNSDSYYWVGGGSGDGGFSGGIVGGGWRVIR